MDQKKISGLVLALLAVVTGGASAALMYESSQIEQLSHSVSALSDRIDKLTEGRSDVMAPKDARLAESRILATSPDGRFVLRGAGECRGEFEVSAPKAVNENGASYDMYDLGRSAGPEDSDLGSVSVQTATQFKAEPIGEPHKAAFSNADYVVGSLLTDLAAGDCAVFVWEK